jgi:hypothetical protein
MKNVLKVIGIIAMVTVIGFSFAACGGGDDGGGGGSGRTKFEGSWVDWDFLGGRNGNIKFTGNNFAYWNWDSGWDYPQYEGTFVYTDMQITFICRWDGVIGTSLYTLQGNTLVLHQDFLYSWRGEQRSYTKE